MKCGWIGVCLLLVTGCGGGTGPLDGTDAGRDAREDAGIDAGADAGHDATTDAGYDAGDQEPPPLWSWCPEASDCIGGDWSATLRVTGEALYCGLFDMSRTMEEEYALKAKLRLVPGDYPLPDEEGEYPIRLPVCLEFREPGTDPRIAGAGVVRLSHNAVRFFYEIEQPLETASGEAWWMCAYINGPLASLDEPVVLDGAYVDPIVNYVWREFRFSQNACGSHLDVLDFDSCDYDPVPEEKHTVEFVGGRLELFVRIGMVDATRFALFSSAGGTLDGTAFSQDDYWSLMFHPGMHFFIRDFLVLFDNPIGEACGLLVEDLDPGVEPPFGRLATVRCDRTEIEERAITSESLDRP